jgi:hypothetical protein
MQYYLFDLKHETVDRAGTQPRQWLQVHIYDGEKHIKCPCLYITCSYKKIISLQS